VAVAAERVYDAGRIADPCGEVAHRVFLAGLVAFNAARYRERARSTASPRRATLDGLRASLSPRSRDDFGQLGLFPTAKRWMFAISPPENETCAPASVAHEIALTVSRGRYWYAATRSARHAASAMGTSVDSRGIVGES